MSDNFIVTAPVIVSADMLSNLLITAVEGGSSYWARDLEITDWKTGAQISYQDPTLFTREIAWRIKVTDVEDGETYEKTRQDLIQALEAMPPHHVKGVITENWDWISADVWFQCGMLGEITFG